MRIFNDSNPIAVALYFVAVSFIAMFCSNPFIQTISLFGAILLFLMRNGRKNARSHLFALILFVVMILINPLVSHNGATVLLIVNNNPVTLEAILYGISAAVSVIGASYWFRSFSQIMTGDKLLYIFGAFSPKLALILSMALRYVPLFGRQAEKVNNAQKALGLYRDDNIVDKTKGGVRVFSIMITWALENGIITADSMTARGYGIGRRSHFSLFRFRTGDVILLSATILLTAFTIIGIRGQSFEFYPTISVTPFDPLSAAGCISYGIMVLIPAIIGVKEELKWKYLRSKI